MLTRLKVNGFKNLVNVDVRFGPFTCIAGANGVGKSNLFDAINFLSLLADRSLMDAALAVRDAEGRTTDVRSLFHQVGDTYVEEMTFEVEMIVPQQAIDDRGQEAKATTTFLRYTLALGYRKEMGRQLEIHKEELVHINLTEASDYLHFDYSPAWRKSVLEGRRTSSFLSTSTDGNLIKLHQDGSRGRALEFPAANMLRTVLSTTNATENPTALVARREMQSWRLLQLEPSALRKPDSFTAPTQLGTDGSHLPATLYHLAQQAEKKEPTSPWENAAQVYGQVVNALSELIEGVHTVEVDHDEKRELLTLLVHGRDGTAFPARALSDGTLRFLALAVLKLDPLTQGVLCLEEPENGIHPIRIPAMLRLLREIAVDTEEPVGPDNPLRQVIVNTHSPLVVEQVYEDSLLLAELRAGGTAQQQFSYVHFCGLQETWRTKTTPHDAVTKGQILTYLLPVPSNPDLAAQEINLTGNGHLASPQKRRVIDRDDIRQTVERQGWNTF